MFTFQSEKTKEPLFFIGDKGVYTSFEKDHNKRIPPYRDTEKFLDSENFREEYDLSRQ